METKDFINKKIDEDFKSLLRRILERNYSDEDLERLLDKLDGIESLKDLKSIIKGCLKAKPKDITELLNCIKNKIVEANLNKLKEEQKRRKLKHK